MKYYISLFLVLILVTSSVFLVSADEISQEDIYPVDSREADINHLMSERTNLQSKLSILQEGTNKDDNFVTDITDITDVRKIKEYKELITNIQQINDKLYVLGVRELSTEELSKKLDLSDEGPTAVVPGGYTNVQWETYRAIWVKDSVRYEVQHIVASPKGNGFSSIRQSGATLQTTNGGFKAASTNLVKTAAKEGASLIPGVDVAITIFDAAKSFISDLKTTSEVTNVRSNYSWNYNLNVDFMYVKKEGQSDSSQFLTFKSSEVFGSVGWTIENFSYKDGTRILTRTNYMTGSREFRNTPAKHKVGSHAVTAYLNPGSSSTAYVSQVQFMGVNGTVFKTASMPIFNFPSQIQDN